eukprot:gene26525-4040_t
MALTTVTCRPQRSCTLLLLLFTVVAALHVVPIPAAILPTVNENNEKTHLRGGGFVEGLSRSILQVDSTVEDVPGQPPPPPPPPPPDMLGSCSPIQGMSGPFSVKFNVVDGPADIVAPPVFTIHGQFKHIACTGDNQAALYVLMAKLADSTQCPQQHGVSKDSPPKGGGAACSCLWDVVSSLAAVYYRMADGSAFFPPPDVADPFAQVAQVTPAMLAASKANFLLLPGPDASEAAIEAWKAEPAGGMPGMLAAANTYCHMQNHSAMAVMVTTALLRDVARLELRIAGSNLDAEKWARVNGVEVQAQIPSSVLTALEAVSTQMLVRRSLLRTHQTDSNAVANLDTNQDTTWDEYATLHHSGRHLNFFGWLVKAAKFAVGFIPSPIRGVISAVVSLVKGIRKRDSVGE